MKKILLAVILLAALVVPVMAQDVSVSPIVNLPVIWGTELISSAGPTVLLVKVWTPFDDARYKIKWAIFNEKGAKVRNGNSGWFWWKSGSQLNFETPVEPSLKMGRGFYVKATLAYAPYVEN